MATVRFTSHLKRFFDDLDETEIDGGSVAEILEKLETLHPGILDYICDESGALRKHVNIFVGQQLIADRTRLSDPVETSDQLYVMQALSGG